MDENERQKPTEKPVPPTAPCPDCGQSFKTSQGLAGLWRLAHSDLTSPQFG